MVRLRQKLAPCYVFTEDKKLFDQLVEILDGLYDLEWIKGLSNQISMLSENLEIPVIIDLHCIEEQAFLLEKANFIRKSNMIHLSRLSDSKNLAFLSCYQNCHHVIAKDSPDIKHLVLNILEKCNQTQPWGIEHCLQVSEYIRQEFFSQTSQELEIRNKIEAWTKRIESHSGLKDIVQSIAIELLKNAVVDAPSQRAERNTRLELLELGENIVLKKEERIVLQCGWDSKYLGISVLDSYGTLSRPSVISAILQLTRGEKTSENLQKHGLFEAFKESLYLSFNVAPGQKTEIICLIPLKERLKETSSHAKSVSFFQIDKSDRNAA